MVLENTSEVITMQKLTADEIRHIRNCAYSCRFCAQLKRSHGFKAREVDNAILLFDQEMPIKIIAKEENMDVRSLKGILKLAGRI